jgi:hypothetical protein
MCRSKTSLTAGILIYLYKLISIQLISIILDIKGSTTIEK